MSGPLVGLVIEHGPEDHHEWAVAVVIAEDMHHPGDTALLSQDEIATRARMSRATVSRAVRRMVAAGRMIYTPGSGRGHANRYRLLWTTPETVSEGHLLEPEKVSPTDTLSAGKCVCGNVKCVHRLHPTVTVKDTTTNSGGGGADPADSKSTPTTSSSAPPAEHQGSLLPVLQGGRSATAGAELDPDLVDYRRCLIRDLGEHWPRRSWEGVRLVQRALDVDGWDWGDLVAMLADEAEKPTTKNAPGLIMEILRGRPEPLPEQRADYVWTPPAPKWCGECVDGWVKDENGQRSEMWCRCKSDGSGATVTSKRPFTIPGGKASRWSA